MAPLDQLSSRDARRLAIGAQGLGRSRPRGSARPADLRRVLGEVAVLQLDAINIVERTQFLVLFSRLGDYDRDLVHRTAGPGGSIYEYWAHAASVIPVDHEPLFRWRMERGGYYVGPKNLERIAAWRKEHAAYLAAVHDEIRERGPLAASELSDPRRNDGEWWGRRSTGRQALEMLFATGEVGGWRRPDFERVYDVRERIVPAEIRARPTPTTEEAHRDLLEIAAGALGVGTVTDLADYHRIPNKEARPRVAELVEDGRLVPLEVEGWRDTAYARPETRPRRHTRTHATLLSPFDSLIWERARTSRLFGFDFKLEVYVPAPKRRWGYYVLPLLLGDELVARFDLKGDRASSTLEVRAAHGEADIDAGPVAEAALDELRALARWLGLERVAVSRRGDLAAALRGITGGRATPV